MAALPLLALAGLLAPPQGNPTFAPAAYYPASRFASDVDHGDFNSDGRLDLIVAGRGSPFGPGEVALLLGQPNGTYGPKQVSNVVGEPSWGNVGDLDGDGDLDFVASMIGAAGVLLGNGAGGFTTGIIFQAPKAPSLADVNHDGNLDLLGTGQMAGLELQLGNGAGAFGPPIQFATPQVFHRSAVADLDHDGNLDVLATAPPTLHWLSGNGAGGFTPKTTAPTFTSSSTGLATGDFDHDGNLDVACASLTEGATVLRGNGVSSIVFVGTFTMGNAPISVQLADLNGDAIEDLATGNQGSEDLTVRVGDGAGGFGGVLSFPLNTYVPFPPHGTNATDVADLDGDGRLDVAAANYWDSAAAVLVNQTAYPTGVLEFGTGTPGCDGFHGINLSRIPQIGASDLVIFSTQAPPHALELLLVTDTANPAGADELGVGCLLHASLLSSTFVMAADMTSDGLGVARALTPVPNNPFLVGSAFHAQSISYFPGGCPSNPLGLTSSRGATITIQP